LKKLLNINKNIKINVDNKAYLSITKKKNEKDRFKNIDIKYKFIQEEMNEKKKKNKITKYKKKKKIK